MNNHLIILVGIPGCGKSTWTTAYANHIVVSSDQIRESFGNINDQTQNIKVFEKFHNDIALCLKKGQNVIADSTALNPSSRAQLVALAQSADVPVHLVYFSNIAGAMFRNQNRTRVVPAHAMARMIRHFIQFLKDLPSEIKSYTSVTQIVT